MKKSIFNLILILFSLIIVFFITAPIIKLFTFSDISTIYKTALEKEVIESIFLTLKASFVATLITLVLGIPLAYLLARYKFKGKIFLESIINIPVIIPHTAAGIALLTVYGDNFFMGKLVNKFGMSFTGEFAGIVVAMMFVSMPFLINESKEGFKKIDVKYEKVARTLGATPSKAFFKVALPMNKNHILSGSLMMWARGISEYGAVLVLAYHPMVAPTMIYERFSSYGLKYSIPVATVMILITLVIFSVFKIIQEGDNEYDKN
jgi:molybdate/tungstate transport system permease protein